MEKVMSTSIDDTGMLRLIFNENKGVEAYRITYTPPNRGTEDEVIIYSNRFKMNASMKFFQLCTGQLTINSWLGESEV